MPIVLGSRTMIWKIFQSENSHETHDEFSDWKIFHKFSISGKFGGVWDFRASGSKIPIGAREARSSKLGTIFQKFLNFEEK